MTPLITICVPAYQAARFLPETLASIRAQTHTDWELIVTEDGSADPVEDLVAAFAATGPQSVTYQRHPRNQGLPAARNTGIAAARGIWIALLDSDDIWTADHLADLLLRARHEPAAELIHAGSVLFDSDTGRPLEVRAPTPATVRSYPCSLYLGDYSVQPSSVLLKKSLWTRVGGFDPAYRYVEDREMWLRCARAGAGIAFTGRNTCRYRKHASALTTHAAPMALASARVLQQHLDWNVISSPLRHRITAEAWMSAGRLALRAAPRIARDCFSRAWRIHRSARIAAYWLLAALFSLKPAPATSPATT
ncbi:MAG: glycosyltransferase family 2 protein [Burkholderiales bacterium]|nr:glycosyltransferase family 2 protein [Opitutaceae bacterium]